jgi:hypothetical protein
MAARSTMAWLLRELRHKVHDEGPAVLEPNQYFAGDSIRLNCTYYDLDGNAMDPSSPAVSIWDFEGVKRIDAATPAYAGETGKYYHIYQIPSDGPEGAWRVVFSATVGNQVSGYTMEFEVVITRRIWTDEQLQTYLDMHRIHVIRELLTKDAEESAFHSNFGMFEDDVTLWDSNFAGASQLPASSFNANLVDGVFIFTQQYYGDCYLDGKSYDLHGVIAECMEQLVTDPSKAREWERGGVRYSHYDYMEMAKYHRSLSRNLAGIRSVKTAKTYS